MTEGVTKRHLSFFEKLIRPTSRNPLSYPGITASLLRWIIRNSSVPSPELLKTGDSPASKY